MIELERIDCSSLTEGVDVTLLESITEKPSVSFASDVPEERAFFMKEEFATFSCMETFAENCCEFRLISQIPWMDHYAWALFNSHYLKMDRGDVARKQHGKYAYVSQSVCFELLDGADYGYFQMICLPDEVFHDGVMYHKFDMLLFVVYRNCKVRRLMVTPPVITLNPCINQTYIPIVPGQHLQIVTLDQDHIEIDEDNMGVLVGSDKMFILGRTNGKQDKMKVVTYVCKVQDSIIFVGDKTVILPKVYVEENKSRIKILKPLGDMAVYTDDIDIVQIVCPEKEKWAWDEDVVDIVGIDDGVEIRLLKKLPSLCLQYDNKDIWWVFASKNVVGTMSITPTL